MTDNSTLHELQDKALAASKRMYDLESSYVPVTLQDLRGAVASADRGDAASAFNLGVSYCGTPFASTAASDLLQRFMANTRLRGWGAYEAFAQSLLPRDFGEAHRRFEQALSLVTHAGARSSMALEIARRCISTVREVPVAEYIARKAAGDAHPGGTAPQHWNNWTLYAAYLLDLHFSYTGVGRGDTLTAALLGTGLLVALGAPDPAHFPDCPAGEWAEDLADEFNERLADCATFAATGRDVLGTVAAGLHGGAAPAHARWLLCRANQDLYGAMIAFGLDETRKIRHVAATVPLEVRGILTEAIRVQVGRQVFSADGTLSAGARNAPYLVSLWSLLTLTEMMSPEHPRDPDLPALYSYVDAVRGQDVVAAGLTYLLSVGPQKSADEHADVFDRTLGHFDVVPTPATVGDYDPFFVVQVVGSAKSDIEQIRHAAETLAAETRRREMQEVLIAGAAHQFGGTIAALTANARRGNEQRATLAETRTLNSLLDLFALVSGDAPRMRAALAADNDGDTDMAMVAASALRHALVALLAERRRRAIDRFLLRYARQNGLVPADLTIQAWRKDKLYQPVAPRLASTWEDELVGPMASASLPQLCDWMADRFFAFSATSIDTAARRFSHDGPLQALLLTVLTEMLVNAIKHYEIDSGEGIMLSISDDGAHITLSCSNPASPASRMNPTGGGFGRGLDYLEMIAEKLDGTLARPDESDRPCTTFSFTIPETS